MSEIWLCVKCFSVCRRLASDLWDRESERNDDRQRESNVKDRNGEGKTVQNKTKKDIRKGWKKEVKKSIKTRKDRSIERWRGHKVKKDNERKKLGLTEQGQKEGLLDEDSQREGWNDASRKELKLRKDKDMRKLGWKEGRTDVAEVKEWKKNGDSKKDLRHTALLVSQLSAFNFGEK